MVRRVFAFLCCLFWFGDFRTVLVKNNLQDGICGLPQPQESVDLQKSFSLPLGHGLVRHNPKCPINFGLWTINVIGPWTVHGFYLWGFWPLPDRALMMMLLVPEPPSYSPDIAFDSVRSNGIGGR